jgi:hypothetical protein
MTAQLLGKPFRTAAVLIAATVSLPEWACYG